MKTILMAAVAAFGLTVAAGAHAAGGYNDPKGDPQYTACVAKALKDYEGGGQASKVAGQTNAEAWCTCMWNETPDSFSGDLVSFAESDPGKPVNKLCEKHAGWGN